MPIARCNGMELHYRERGEGEPLILLMGLGADGSLWEDHASEYEKHFRCILVDNRGAGGSSKPEGAYSTEEMARDTLGLLRELNIERAHFSGISMGSAIAQQIALLSPDSVKSLTLNCSWSACDTYTASIFETFAAAYEAMNADDYQKLLQLFIFTPAYHERYSDELIKRRREAADNRQPMPVHAFQAQCAACVSHNTAGNLHAIQAPTLITAGDNDIFTPLRLSVDIAGEIPHAEFEVFEGSGHTHHWDQLERFNTRTLSFMRSHST